MSDKANTGSLTELEAYKHEALRLLNKINQLERDLDNMQRIASSAILEIKVIKLRAAIVGLR